MLQPYLYVSTIVPNPHYLILAMGVMVGSLSLIITFMLIFLVWKNKRGKRQKEWQQQLIATLQRAIYFETEENSSPVIPLTFRTIRHLKKPAFRQLMIDELMQAKKALTGTAAGNITALFNQLHLDELSLQKLRSRKWHLKARGIQELSVMHQQQYTTRIYRLTNAYHELVRMEAQSAIVQLHGFEGLRFLDIVDHPISEWQQIKLLRLLSRTPGTLPENAGGWLSSANDSVVIFALKLVAEHQQQLLHPQVAACLDHPHPQVRLQAVRCLRDIYTDDTSAVLKKVYDAQILPCKLAILETLGHIGSGDDCIFLSLQLVRPGNSLKLA
ncbi:MAG TPA: hypothetical protein VHC48_09135, partial [Puia sp.]|nr:hypothetical protein [Puia sp.]